jgi:hypothetical protein
MPVDVVEIAMFAVFRVERSGSDVEDLSWSLRARQRPAGDYDGVLVMNA